MPSQTDLPPALGDYIRKSGVALAVSTTGGDAPLIAVNEAFCKLTGYSEDEVTGKNCRFLQGPNTTEEERQPLHDFVHGQGGDSDRFPITNYRKDGSEFRNFVFMSRLYDAHGKAQLILASQFDMTSAMQRSEIAKNDAKLSQALTDVEQIGREYGFAMMGSAQLIADSVATLARMSFSDSR
ncbi:PAS domain-containing protein [Roseovarius sp.]|uniref:PAS domain-containing protein n=1 Tax=Roseovarius sp. TaxID=1486281 RepID=UPI002614C358|nr:PAS domain-containing protein [Roseovarius sp.]MDM8167730.1 PAS domain-containing protein [Roseovarius sp.]